MVDLFQPGPTCRTKGSNFLGAILLILPLPRVEAAKCDLIYNQLVEHDLVDNFRGREVASIARNAL